MTVPALLVAEHIELAHHQHVVVREFSFALQSGEILCLMGPSGCGKTTLLRALAGLHPLQKGRLLLRGQTIASSAQHARPEQLKIGFVFQDLALFPHLTAAENIALGLGSLSRLEADARVKDLLNGLGLTGCANRYPHALSGGQQQRVAIARAMAPKYDLVLLDEPFSSLDAQLRVELSRLLRNQLKQSGAAAIMVSHDQEEGLVCADRVAVMQSGRLLQLGTPVEVYGAPANAAVAEFIGESVWLPGTVQNGLVRSVFGAFAAGEEHAALVAINSPEPLPIRLLLRPEDIELCTAETENACPARVLSSEFRGAYLSYRLRLEKASSSFEVQLAMHGSDASGAQHLTAGSVTYLRLKRLGLRVFPA